MAKSWDNCSKIGFREIADRFVVWSEYMREEAIKFQCYTSEQIEIVGIPQFDSYCNLPIPDKAIFFKKYGLDLNKKLIFFGSEGPISDDPEKNKDYVVSFIKEKIIDGTLKDYQILVRPHFSYINDFDRFNILADGELVFVDKDYVRSNSKDGIELSLNNIINLMGAVKYSDAIVVGASTLILDVIANSKMPIIYGFDRTEDTPKYDSVKRFFEYLWMKNLLAVGLDNVAKSREQLIDKIKNFSRLNELKQKEKELVESRFCYRLDGLSGKRLFGFIDKLLN
jgi:hypothetical protein